RADLAKPRMPRLQPARLDESILERDVPLEAVEDQTEQTDRVRERRPEHAKPIVRVVYDRVVDDQRRGAMLDLFDEVPREERGDARIARREQRGPVVEDHLEERRKRRLERRDIREQVLDRALLLELAKRRVHLVEGHLQARVARKQRANVKSVRRRVQ